MSADSSGRHWRQAELSNQAREDGPRPKITREPLARMPMPPCRTVLAMRIAAGRNEEQELRTVADRIDNKKKG